MTAVPASELDTKELSWDDRSYRLVDHIESVDAWCRAGRRHCVGIYIDASAKGFQVRFHVEVRDRKGNLVCKAGRTSARTSSNGSRQSPSGWYQANREGQQALTG